jgi:hypothetical protein
MNYAKDFVQRSAKAFIAAGVAGVTTWFADGGHSDLTSIDSIVKGAVAAFLGGVATWVTKNKT